MNIKSILFVLPLILMGCGGDDSELSTPTPEPEASPPVTPPSSNSAPQASDDFSISEDNNAILINVLANDSDEDDDDLSIQMILNEPLNGSVSIEDNAIVYTPNSFYAGADSFSYQISDGEFTSEAVVTIQVTQSITINGIVAGGPVSGATVTASLSSGQFTAVTDEQGAYSLDLVLSTLTDVVILNAVGDDANNQASVELESFIGTTQELLNLVSDQRVVDNNTLFQTNITNVSTAILLLVQEANAGTVPSTLEAFSSIMESVNAEALLELAAFINILIDNPNFAVPEGQTNLSIFQSEEEQTIRLVINAYLESVGAFDENNGPSESYLDAESTAIDAIVQNTLLLPSFDIENVSQLNLIATFGNVFGGFLPETGEVYQLNGNGSGQFYSEFNMSLREFHFTSQINWQLEQDRINVDFSSDIDGELFPRGSALTVVEIQDMFGEDAAQAAMTILEDSNFNNDRVTVTFTDRPVSAQIVPINIGDTVAQVRVITRLQVTGELVSSFEETNPTFEALELSTSSENINLYVSPESVLKNNNSESLTGRWVLPLEYIYTAVTDGTPFSRSLTGILNDILTFNVNGTVDAQLSEQRLSWNLTSSGEIELTAGDTQYMILPIIDNNNELLAQVTQSVEGNIEDVFVTRIARFDSSFVLTEEDLVSELPVIRGDFAGVGFDGAIWNTGQLNINAIVGEHSLQADGTASYYTQTNFSEGRIFNPIRTGSWNLNSEQFNVRYFFPGEIATQSGFGTLAFSDDFQWVPIGVNENGWLYVFQLRTNFFELAEDGDGRFDESDIPGTVFEPVIEIIIPIDLSTYEEEYERSILMGTVPPLP